MQLESFLAHSRETSAQLRQVNSGMERLVQKSADIGSVVTTIQEIAGQTNLLALNAAIESARAGKRGKASLSSPKRCESWPRKPPKRPW